MQRNIKTNNLPCRGAYLLCEGVYARCPMFSFVYNIFGSANRPVYYAIATDAYEGRRISTGVYLVLVSNDERIEKVKAKT